MENECVRSGYENLGKQDPEAYERARKELGDTDYTFVDFLFLFMKYQKPSQVSTSLPDDGTSILRGVVTKASNIS
jgi:hypothetical protein